MRRTLRFLWRSGLAIPIILLGLMWVNILFPVPEPVKVGWGILGDLAMCLWAWSYLFIHPALFLWVAIIVLVVWALFCWDADGRRIVRDLWRSL